MTSESKILTVSYGTFSCTLEGFDNPFDTMKAIAEYFRDLAAQDRHFGAEPPPPDAAMLHRLAEREVSRLAASKMDDAARLPSAGEAEAPSPRIQINPVLRHQAQPPVEPEPEVTEAATAPEPSLSDVIPDGVAAKLARIRNAVNPAFAVTDTPAARESVVAERISVPADVPGDATITDIALMPEVDPAEITPHPGSDASDVAARLGELIASEPVPAAGYGNDVEALPAGVELADVWSLAGAGDMAEGGPIAAQPFTESEADVVLPIEPEVASAEWDDVVSIADDLDEVALHDHPIADDFTADDVALLAQLDGTVFDEDSLAAALDDSLPEDRPEELDLTEAALQDPLPESVATETGTDAPLEEIAAAALSEPAPEAVKNAPLPGDLSVNKNGPRARRVNSRVVRIHPSEVPSDPGATRIIESGEEAHEIARLMQQAEEVMAEEENRRRHEALSRLKAAVVATEADRADIDYEAPNADADLDPYRGDLAEAIQPDAAREPQPDPEVKPSRRKSVLIRPAEQRPGTIRPGMISPPPLVLVSEQRIDRVAPAAAPVPAPSPAPARAPTNSPSAPEGQPMVALRTGRLSGAIGAGAAVAASGLPARNLVLEKPSYGTAAETEEDEDLAEDSKDIDEAGFATFADMVGARSMAEMLEAAAAYATCVEKRSQFTRPQLMRRMMASAGGRPVSREDGLRSFGTLLRTGRIEKVTRGHYSLAENSPYLAEARRLG